MWKFLTMLGINWETVADGKYKWIQDVYDVLTPLLYAIMGIVGAAGAVYSIVLGVNLARAEDQSKRDEAKKRLITTLIAVGVTIALCLFFTLLFPKILEAFLQPKASSGS